MMLWNDNNQQYNCSSMRKLLVSQTPLSPQHVIRRVLSLQCRKTKSNHARTISSFASYSIFFFSPFFVDSATAEEQLRSVTASTLHCIMQSRNQCCDGLESVVCWIFGSRTDLSLERRGLRTVLYGTYRTSHYTQHSRTIHKIIRRLASTMMYV